ncbi:protease3 [Salinivirga cyanobacteriivorans]|uniref:Protease3 n=1 Tax=Salinivirga cyanobacteriivorans TaxID=1307839 RepID=A0A0S2I564_9BACT|nr:insulinase family protein [Salinivirga cyanobacteriivorans]ALO17084.1 protease3 [Salinivirga cyanobacteriivorans]
MYKIKMIVIATIGMFLMGCAGNGEKHEVIQKEDSNGYAYKEVTNDPYHARVYTLDNGLKVYLSVNRDEPRVQTYIGVKAGSSYDPAETTGLAHYLEHMMFKGTGKIGALDWETEKAMIEEISELYEQHKATDDDNEKKAIYAKIDSISYQAAKMVAANEYDKLMSTLGAKGTNAYTSNERTVYMNDIPANELEKWLMVESERFSQLVLRLFHTELETVYEEFNMGQDQDGRQAYQALYKNLFPGHVYGEQSTIGKPEHLKNPSMVNIHNYFDTYYVPNNMAIAMVGDIDMDETIKMVDEHFGKLEKNPVEPINHGKADPIKGIVRDTVSGPQPASVRVAFRFDGVKSDDRKYVSLIDHILSNRTAGLIDLNLVQEQKVQMAASYSSFLQDYGTHVFYGMPRSEQSLQEVADLMLAELDKIKSGDFDDWLLEACIKDMKVSKIRKLEGKWRAHDFIDAFTNDFAWENYITFIEDLEKITKEDLVKFANENYGDDYVVIYKEQGPRTAAVKVDKPEITSLELNRDVQSDFFQKVTSEPAKRLDPMFIDFDKRIDHAEVTNGVKLSYIENKTNELFRMQYIIPMGKNHNNMIPLAVEYLEYLGTEKYTPAEFKKELFKYGLSFGVYASSEDAYVYISGLEESLDKGVELLEHMIANAKPDQEAYDKYVQKILKDRSNAKEDKNSILWNGMLNYGLYGEESSFTNIIPEEKLKNIAPQALTDLVKDLYSYKHEIFYYGSRPTKELTALLAEKHQIPEELKPVPEPTDYAVREVDQNEVYFVDYDMIQSNILLLSKDQQFDKELMPYARMFNEFYGSGLSSIVFQEIREAKALAYSAFSAFTTPSKQDDDHLIYGFVGTQPDKIKIATNALMGLMDEMPEAQKQFESAREAILKKIESERITKDQIYWTYRRNNKRGIDHDFRKDVYQKVQNMSLEEFKDFFNNHISGKNYTYMVMGDRESVDMNILAQIGTVKELTLEELFNY